LKCVQDWYPFSLADTPEKGESFDSCATPEATIVDPTSATQVGEVGGNLC